MKKIKLACLTMGTALATVTPLIALTSCKDDPKKTSDIEIKSNPNIKIKCDGIEVGKEAVLTYTLDNNYAFNLEQSHIDFANGTSYSRITLLDCDVDRINHTITIPAEHVVAKKMIVDIKAENATSSKVTQAEFTEAKKLLTNISSSRKFTMDGFQNFYTKAEGQETECTLRSTLMIEATGTKEFINQHIENPQYGTESNTQVSSEPDTTIGYWQYVTDTKSLPIKSPIICPFGSITLQKMLNSEEMQLIDDFTYDPLYNAYFYQNLTTTSESITAIKFVNKQIIYLGAVGGGTDGQGTINASTLSYDIKYESEEITCPTEFVYNELNEIHDEDSKYSGGISGVDYTYDTEKDDFIGRYTIPMSDYSPWDKTKKIMISIDAETKENLDALDFALASNNTVLTKDTDFTFDSTTGILTINENVLEDPSDDLILLVCDNNLLDKRAHIEKYTKLHVYQE